MPEATISSENQAASTSAIPSIQETHGASTSLKVSSSPRTKSKSDKNELDAISSTSSVSTKALAEKFL